MFAVGDEVEGNFEGAGKWYSGKIQRVNPDVRGCFGAGRGAVLGRRWFWLGWRGGGRGGAALGRR